VPATGWWTTVLERIPLRLRLALIFTVGMAVVLIAVAAFVYKQVSIDLLATVDSGLLSRAELIEKAIDQQQGAVVNDPSNLIDPDEAFAQILDSSGRILDASSAASDQALVPPDQLQGFGSLTFVTRSVPGIDYPARLLVDPVTVGGRQVYLVVGAKLGDRQDALDSLMNSLAIGGAAALLVMSLAGWLLAGAALRPVERMRRDAAAISVLEPERRLRVPPANDELARLARTLNDLLDRLSELLARERTFVDHASHELRTPLSILKAELDLAASRRRPRSELERTIQKAASETDRLIRLSRDLLVLARMHQGRVPISRRPVSLQSLLEQTRLAWDSRLKAAGLQLQAQAPDSIVLIDGPRVRQALDNLLDNAVRHANGGGPVVVEAVVAKGQVVISVENPGEPFPAWVLPRAFEPFVTGADDDAAGAGLGLAIVRAIAIAHQGDAVAENLDGKGVRVAITLIADETTPV
jgi:signal transduction histidine kinase